MARRTARKERQAGLTRREFSKILAVGTISAALPQGATVAAGGVPNAVHEDGLELSAEAEAQYKVLISRFGSRLSEEQKGDVRRLIDQNLKSNAVLRSFHLENSDEPGNVFRARLIAEE